jgi:hypothetical protein
MPDLPSGTVTFLFTDIEDSTACWEHDRQAMAVAVRRHIDLLDAGPVTLGSKRLGHGKVTITLDTYNDWDRVLPRAVQCSRSILDVLLDIPLLQGGTTMTRQAGFAPTLAVLAALTLSTAPTTAQQTTYHSPTFGYTLIYNEDWSVVAQTTEEGSDTLALTNGTSTIILVGQPFPPGTDAMACIAQIPAELRANPALAGAVLAEGPSGDATHAWARFSLLDSAQLNDPGAVLYVECQPLASGEAALVTFQHVAAAAYDDQVAHRVALLEGLRLEEPAMAGTPSPAAAGTTPDVAALQTRVAELEATIAALQTPAAAPSEDSIAVPDGNLVVPWPGARPGYVRGSVTDAQGRPIAVPGTVVTIRISGTTMAGERTSFDSRVDAAGRYEERVPDGKYSVTATIRVSYQDKQFSLWLHPATGDRYQDYDVGQGIVKDFIWHISGPTGYGTSDQNPEDYYGGSLTISDGRRGSGGTMAERYPADARIVLTLTPLGPLLDGSEGQVISRELDLQGKPVEGAGAGGFYVLDIPLGAYTATARVVVPGRGEAPLVLSDGEVGSGRPYVGAFNFVFEPGANLGTETKQLFVTDS